MTNLETEFGISTARAIELSKVCSDVYNSTKNNAEMLTKIETINNLTRFEKNYALFILGMFEKCQQDARTKKFLELLEAEKQRS